MMKVTEKAFHSRWQQEEEVEKATMSLAAAKEISVDSTVETVLPELEGIFPLNEEQRTTLKALLNF